MRKIIAILLCCMCVVSLVGCSQEPALAPTEPSHLQVPETAPPTENVENVSPSENTEPAPNESSRPSPLEIDEAGLPVVTLETVDVASVLKAAYNNTFKLPLMHVTSTRSWHGEPEAKNASMDTSNRTYDAWLYNTTGEAIWRETHTYDENNSTSKNLYVLRQGDPNGTVFEYKVYQNGRKCVDDAWEEQPARCVSGYESVITSHWPMLLAFEDAYTLTMTAEGDYYILSSKPLVSEGIFPWSDGVCIVTMYIRAKTLTFSTITVAGPYWVEAAMFKFFADDCDNRFYTTEVQKVLNMETNGTTSYATYKDWLKNKERAAVINYDDAKKVLAENNVNEYWSIAG